MKGYAKLNVQENYKMDTGYKVSAVFNAAQYAAVAAQPYYIFQWIQLGLAILCSVVLLAYRIWAWYKKAKSDGKITKDEVEDLVDIVKDGVEDVKDKIDKNKPEE